MDPSATAHLRREHRLIERILERTEAACDDLDVPQLTRSVEFFLRFVDGVHHAKEETALFPALREWALGPSFRPLRVLLEEHQQTRTQLERAEALLPLLNHDSEEVAPVLASVVREYCEQLSDHIHREDAMLLPLADRAIPSHAQAGLLDAMHKTQEKLMSDSEYQRWVREAEPAPLAQSKLETMVVRMKGPKRPKEASAPLDARNLSALDNDHESSSDSRADDTQLSAKSAQTLFDKAGHRNLLLQDFGRGLSVQSNQYLITDGGLGMLLDPGGPKVYPDVLAQTMLHVTPETLKYIFLSHQDPDIGTSINAWLMDTEADAYISRLWVRFLPHFGIDRLMEERLKPIPDNGMVLELGQSKLVLVPAHFLHSPGNFQVYDPTSKILFSGDLGASAGIDYSVVTDFDAHVRQMEGFHQRYMASRAATAAWARIARQLDIECIAPQHGAIMRGRDMVERFIDWASSVPCGADLLGQRYSLPPW